MRIVVYSRSSSSLQHDASCEDRECQVVHGLERMDIDPSRAEFMRDKAAQGTKERRDKYDEIKRMISRHEEFILAVDDLSRLNRKADITALIRGLVLAGGRVVAIADGIDTEKIAGCDRGEEVRDE